MNFFPNSSSNCDNWYQSYQFSACDSQIAVANLEQNGLRNPYAGAMEAIKEDGVTQSYRSSNFLTFFHPSTPHLYQFSIPPPPPPICNSYLAQPPPSPEPPPVAYANTAAPYCNTYISPYTSNDPPYCNIVPQYITIPLHYAISQPYSITPATSITKNDETPVNIPYFPLASDNSQYNTFNPHSPVTNCIPVHEENNFQHQPPNSQLFLPNYNPTPLPIQYPNDQQQIHNPTVTQPSYPNYQPQLCTPSLSFFDSSFPSMVTVDVDTNSTSVTDVDGIIVARTRALETEVLAEIVRGHEEGLDSIREVKWGKSNATAENEEDEAEHQVFVERSETEMVKVSESKSVGNEPSEVVHNLFARMHEPVKITEQQIIREKFVEDEGVLSKINCEFNFLQTMVEYVNLHQGSRYDFDIWNYWLRNGLNFGFDPGDLPKWVKFLWSNPHILINIFQYGFTNSKCSMRSSGIKFLHYYCLCGFDTIATDVAIGIDHQGVQVQGHVNKYGLGYKVDINNTLVHFHIHYGIFENAPKLLDKVSRRNISSANVIWPLCELMAQYLFHSEMESNEAVYLNTLILGDAQNGYDKEGIKLFCCMVEEDFRWNEHTSAGVGAYSLVVVVCAAKLIVKGSPILSILHPSVVGLYLTLFCTKKSLTSYVSFVILGRLMVTLFVWHYFEDLNIRFTCMALKSFCKFIVSSIVVGMVEPVLTQLPPQLHVLIESGLISHILLLCYIENHFYSSSNIYNYSLEGDVIHQICMVLMTTFSGSGFWEEAFWGNRIKHKFVWYLNCLYSSKLAMLFITSISVLWESTMLFLTISHPMLLCKDKSRTTLKVKPWQIYAHAGIINLSIWFYHEIFFEAPHRCKGIPPYDGLSLGFYNLLWLLIPLLLWTYHSMVIKAAQESIDDISNYDFMTSKSSWPSWVLVAVFCSTVAKNSSTIPIKAVDYDASIGKMEKRKIKALKVTSFCVTFRRILIKGDVAVHYDLKEFERLQLFNFDQKMGSQIIQNALKACVHPLFLMLEYMELLCLLRC